MGFWESGSGKKITGTSDDAFIPEFTIIPNGTIADAVIKSFFLVEKDNKFTSLTDKYYELTYKLVSGDYKNREVTQKIKAFSGTPAQVDRALNMLRLVLTLCDYTPTHKDAPTDIDLLPTMGKMVCIKIREWSMPKNDGPGNIEGNFVSEVHASGALPAETGTKMEQAVVTRSVDSALNRNSTLVDLKDDLPF